MTFSMFLLSETCHQHKVSPTSVTNIDVALIMRYLCQEVLFDATFQKWIQGRPSKWAFRHFKLKSYFGFEFEISAGLITQLGHSWVCYEVYTFLKSVYTSKKSFDGKLISVRFTGVLNYSNTYYYVIVPRWSKPIKSITAGCIASNTSFYW